MKRRLRVLFYGVTHEHAIGKFETLRKLADDFEIVAVVDDRARGTARFAKPIDLTGQNVIPESEAWDVEDVDVGFVETTNADLMGVAAEFIERGIPIHCDKPSGEAMEPYRSLVETCRERNLPFQIGYMFRGNPAVKWIWKHVRAGKLGDLRFIEADMNHDYQADGYAEYLSTFKGGIFYNLCCHLADMVVPLLSAPCSDAHAFLSPTNGKAYLRCGGTDVLLRAAAHLPGGTLARRLRIDGTKGTIDLCPIERFDGKPLTLQRVAGSDVQTFDFGVQTDRYAGQLLDLAAIVRGDKPNDQDYDWDLKTHELLLKACAGVQGEGWK
ncbi:MAG: Gfo/Idh/MocA family protein [Kiritimatiellia bacterium]|jgi:predicted dehydrogenase